MVQRMVGPNAVTAWALGKEVGIAQTTLSRWLRAAHRAEMGKKKTAAERPASSTPGRSAEDKMRLVLAAAELGPDERGAFLRREGVHEGELEVWRTAMLQALGARPVNSGPPRPADQRRIRELEKEVRRKDQALAETAALLVLAKKAESLWGDVDDGTDDRSET
jgi:transposase-like protein